jgi:hypothetical protein
MGDYADKGNGDESRQGKWFFSIGQVFNPRAIEFMVGILATVGIDQNVDIGHLHRNSPPLVPELGQLPCCMVKMKCLAVNGHFEIGGIVLGELIGKKITPKRRIHQFTQRRPFIAGLSLRASKKLVI